MMVRYQHDVEWAALVGEHWHHHLMDAHLSDRLHTKQGRSIARWTVTGNRRQFVVFVKRHYQHSRWQSLLARLAPLCHWSDAGREWSHLQKVRKLGIAVPRPLAVAEWIGPGSRLRSALVVEELSDMVPLHEAIPIAVKSLTKDQFHDWKRGLLAEMARIVRLLHDRGYFHRDLYLCHFFIARADLDRVPTRWHDRLALIDFHRLTRRRLFMFRARAKDLAQLLYSARVEGVTMNDALNFWRLYGGNRVLRWAVQLKASLYRRHDRPR